MELEERGEGVGEDGGDGEMRGSSGGDDVGESGGDAADEIEARRDSGVEEGEDHDVEVFGESGEEELTYPGVGDMARGERGSLGEEAVGERLVVEAVDEKGEVGVERRLEIEGEVMRHSVEEESLP